MQKMFKIKQTSGKINVDYFILQLFLSRMLANVNTCGVLSIICSTVCLIFCEISNCTSVSPSACSKLYIDVTLS